MKFLQSSGSPRQAMPKGSTTPSSGSLRDHHHHQQRSFRQSYRKTYANVKAWVKSTRVNTKIRLIGAWDWLRHRRVVTAVNLFVLALTCVQILSILSHGGDSRMTTTVFLASPRVRETLPFPLNLSPLSRRLPMPALSSSIHASNAFPGYAGLKTATFRDRYPSMTVNGTGTFDGLFVLSNSRCSRHLKKFRAKAKERGLSIEPWTITAKVSLSDPPIRIAGDGPVRSGIGGMLVPAVLRREVGYTDTQVRLWRHVVNARLQRVLILDDTLFPTKKLLSVLPAMMVSIDTESVARAKPWHMVYLRRTGLHDVSESIWSWTTGKRQAMVTVANVSHGAGAYILSSNGAQFLLDHVKTFNAPLDVQFGMLQRQFPDRFVALSVCEARHDKSFCPDMISDISIPRPSSEDVESVSFDCTWRRLQEAQTAGGFAEMLRSDYGE